MSAARTAPAAWLVALACLVSAAPAGAQQGQAALLAWRGATILVAPDSIRGVQLFLRTAATEGGAARPAIDAEFEPLLLTQWLASADSVVGPAEGEPRSVRTPVLEGTRGERMALAQLADTAGSPYGLFLQQNGDRRPVLIRATAEMGVDLIRALRRAAATSRVDARRHDLLDSLAFPALTDSDTSRRPRVRQMTAPVYPPALRTLRVEGLVFFRLVVDARGRPDMGTFEVLYAPHPGLAASVRQALAKATFEPGQVRDRPVATRVVESVSFRAAPAPP